MDLEKPVLATPNRELTRRRLLGTTGTLAIGVMAGCLQGDSTTAPDEQSTDTQPDSDSSMESPSKTDQADSTDDGSMNDTQTAEKSQATESETASMSWRSIELTSVQDNETFTVDGFGGPVVIQSFAVWCPKCEQQSKELQNLDEDITLIGLNTDPNEDAEKVQQHINNHGFDWRFAVAPTELTESLIDEFGPTVTNAPSTPIIVICPDGQSELLSGKINSVQEIESKVENC